VPVDEVADPAESHDDRGRDNQRIHHLPEGLAVHRAEQHDAERAADDQTVRGEAADPDVHQQLGPLTIERPLVIDAKDAAAQQHASRQQE
jgi:hypothetical protein